MNKYIDPTSVGNKKIMFLTKRWFFWHGPYLGKIIDIGESMSWVVVWNIISNKQFIINIRNLRVIDTFEN